MKRINKKQILSLILSFALLFSMFSMCITVNATEDTASNNFANWSDSIAADGTLKEGVQGTAFVANPDVWADGKKINEVNFDLAVTMAGAATKFMRIIYSYTDANNYKSLEFRETSSPNCYLYIAFVDVVNGVATKPTNMTATNSVGFHTASQRNTNIPVGFIQGAKVRVQYIDSSNIKFTFDSADGSKSFETQLTASAAANVDFKSASTKFGFFFSTGASNIQFSKISIDWEKSIDDYIAEFRNKYSEVLVDNSDPEDLETVKLAAAEYAEASVAVQEGLSNDYAQLKENFSAMVLEQGSYSTDFETSTEFWEQFADYTDKNGDPVVQDDYAIEDITGKTGGISQSESGKILVGNTTVTTDTYTQSSSLDDSINAVNATMMLSPSKAIWSGAKAKNMDFAQAEFDLWVNLAGNSSGVMIYYNYIDNDNFSYFRILRSPNNCAGVYNMVVGIDETTGLRKRAYNGASNNLPFNNWGTNANNWLRIKIAYNAQGNAVLYLTGEADDVTHSLTSNDVVEKENRMFAVGVSVGGASKATLAMDNFSMLFTDEESQQGIDFEQKYFETLSLNAERFAAYDVAEVDRMITAYEALADSAKQVLANETKSAISALSAARALWNTESDETIAQSYKNIWGAKLETETETAWNVYNRLTAAQKALLTVEYDTMVDVMKNKTQVTDDTININCVGDSITNGNGSTAVATYSYPAQMQAMLGDGYKVSRNGIAGIRVVEDYTITSADDVKLNMAGSAAWDNSHAGEDDIIIIQLGTNDLSQVAGKEQIKADIYEAGLEKLIQSYLRLENSPLIVLSNTPVSYSAKDKGYAYKTIALINMQMAEKYGIPCVDMQAYTEAYTDEDVVAYYGEDRLHPNDDGYTKMAEVFATAIKSLKPTFDTAEVSAYIFDENEINSFLAPEMLAATIKKATTSAGQDLGFRTKISAAVKTGATIVEYGTIFSKYKSDNEETILNRMVYSETADPNMLVAYARGFSSDVAGMEYIAGLGGANNEQVKEAYIARAYVKFSDGSVYYSVNDYKNATSYSERKGVINGYACRSVVSIAKEMVRFLAQNSITDDTIATYEAGTDTLTFSEQAKENYDLVFDFLTEKADVIAELVAGGN